MIGVETDMRKDLEKALKGKTYLDHSGEKEYDFLKCGDIVKDWLESNEKEFYNKLYRK
jgi:hypothetical protein